MKNVAWTDRNNLRGTLDITQVLSSNMLLLWIFGELRLWQEICWSESEKQASYSFPKYLSLIESSETLVIETERQKTQKKGPPQLLERAA